MSWRISGWQWGREAEDVHPWSLPASHLATIWDVDDLSLTLQVRNPRQTKGSLAGMALVTELQACVEASLGSPVASSISLMEKAGVLGLWKRLSSLCTHTAASDPCTEPWSHPVTT
jgi:hypothetical protein